MASLWVRYGFAWGHAALADTERTRSGPTEQTLGLLLVHFLLGCVRSVLYLVMYTTRLALDDASSNFLTVPKDLRFKFLSRSPFPNTSNYEFCHTDAKFRKFIGMIQHVYLNWSFLLYMSFGVMRYI